MHRAIRSQADTKGDKYSQLAVLDCTGSKDMARQEFKEEADINIMLKRFGVTQQQRPIQFGDADYTIDLQQALHAIDDVQKGYDKMSPDVKAIYPTWQKFAQGVESGAVGKDLQRLDKEGKAILATQHIEAELEKEERKAQILRDREAARVSADIKAGKPPKPEEKPNK